MARDLGNLAAGFAGACALLVSAYTAYLQRQQTHAQVMPYVGMGITVNDSSAHLQVVNRGVGPAKVKSAQIFVDTQPVADWKAMLQKLEAGEGKFYSSNFASSVLLAGGDKEVFGSDDPVVVHAMLAGFKRLGFRVCYCSILDDCWVNPTSFDQTSSINDGEPASVRACPKTPRFGL